jgi:hypothetical protein
VTTTDAPQATEDENHLVRCIAALYVEAPKAVVDAIRAVAVKVIAEARANRAVLARLQTADGAADALLAAVGTPARPLKLSGLDPVFPRPPALVDPALTSAIVARRLLMTALGEHPLPWRLEIDWTVEVHAADGAIVAKCQTGAEAQALIDAATTMQAELDAGATEVARMIGDPAPSCGRPAVAEIHPLGDLNPDNSTLSCRRHIGDMLGVRDGEPEPYAYEVHELAPEEMEGSPAPVCCYITPPLAPIPDGVLTTDCVPGQAVDR